MNSSLMILTAGACALLIAGCTPQEQRAGTGALVGGGLGAAVGAIATNGDAGGALVGGAIGAASGALVGGATAPRECYAQDAWGRNVVVPCNQTAVNNAPPPRQQPQTCYVRDRNGQLVQVRC